MRKLFVLTLLIVTVLLIFMGAILTGIWKKPSGQAPYEVGILISGKSRLDKVRGVQDGLAALGLVSPKQVRYHLESAEEDREKLPIAARRLARQNLDVIIAHGGVEVEAAVAAVAEGREQNRKLIPIIFAGVASADAFGIGLNNTKELLTGVENQDAELSGKRLEYLLTIIPQIQRVGLVYQPGIKPSERGRAIASETAQRLSVPTFELPVRSRDEIAAMGQRLRPGDGLILMPSYFIESELPLLHDVASANNIPIMGLRVKDAEQYCLLSFGPTAYQQGLQAARLAALVLQGHSPAELPVETPDRVELVLNLRLADSMGIVIDERVLRYADRLIVRDTP